MAKVSSFSSAEACTRSCSELFASMLDFVCQIPRPTVAIVVAMVSPIPTQNCLNVRASAISIDHLEHVFSTHLKSHSTPLKQTTHFLLQMSFAIARSLLVAVPW